ncbi:MAG: hypothetical protein ACRDQ7_23600 [Haloechinothrix sp.]
MSTGQKALLAGLVAVVVLFVVAVGAGANNDQGDAEADQGGLVGALLDRFGESGEVGPGDLAGSCVRPDGSLVVQNLCAVEVAPGTQRMRLLRLRSNRPIAVSAPAPGEATFMMNKTFGAGELIEVAVDADRAQIVLNCGIGAVCVLVLDAGAS